MELDFCSSGIVIYLFSGLTGVQILEGTMTVAVGIIAGFVLVDYPATATFLTPEEREYIVWKKSEYFCSLLHLRFPPHLVSPSFHLIRRLPFPTNCTGKQNTTTPAWVKKKNLPFVTSGPHSVTGRYADLPLFRIFPPPSSQIWLHIVIFLSISTPGNITLPFLTTNF